MADLALVAVFVLIGRVSHHERLDPSGVATTAWPFVAGLAAGWLAARAWLAPLTIRTGFIVWPMLVVVGMLLRLLSGQGVQIGFVVVTTVTLGLFVVGWRVVLAGARRLTAR